MLTDPLPWWRILAPAISFVLLTVLARRLPMLHTVWFVSCDFIAYATTQDQFSAHFCPEYFTIGHPPIPNLKQPILLGLAWGFLGGFPGGITLGVPLALICNVGPHPKFQVHQLKQPLLYLLSFMAISTTICALSAIYNSGVVNISIGAPWNVVVPPERHRAFFIIASAHFGTYLSAAIGGFILCIWVWQQRSILSRD